MVHGTIRAPFAAKTTGPAGLPSPDATGVTAVGVRGAAGTGAAVAVGADELAAVVALQAALLALPALVQS